MNKLTQPFIALLLLCCSISFSQTNDELKASALRDAKITSKATLNLDFETVLKHTYPNIVKLMGGETQALKLLDDTFENMKTQGFEFEKADVLSVSDIVFEQDEYRCYVEGYNQMVMTGMRIKSKSYLLGIYNDDSKNWYFIEAKQLKNEAMLNQILPDFKTDLNIPEDDMTTEEI